MANFAFSTYRICGDSEDIDALYNLMTKCEAEDRENGNWVGYIVKALNNDVIPDPISVGGWWFDLKREGEDLTFCQESKWSSIYETWDFIASKYDSLSVFFVSEEEGFGCFEKRDHEELKFFPENYFVRVCDLDGCSEAEIFEHLEDALKYVEASAGQPIKSIEDIERINSEWKKESADAFIEFSEYLRV